MDHSNEKAEDLNKWEGAFERPQEVPARGMAFMQDMTYISSTNGAASNYAYMVRHSTMSKELVQLLIYPKIIIQHINNIFKIDAKKSF